MLFSLDLIFKKVTEIHYLCLINKRVPWQYTKEENLFKGVSQIIALWQNEAGSVLGSSCLPFGNPFSNLGMGNVRQKDGFVVMEFFSFLVCFIIGLFNSVIRIK